MSSTKFCAPTFSLASSRRLPHCRSLLRTTLLKTKPFLVCRDTAPKQLSSRNAVSFSSVVTTNLFPLGIRTKADRVCGTRIDCAGDVMRAVLSTFLDCSDQSYVGTLVLIHVVENATLMVIYTAIIIAQRLGKGDSPRTREFVALPGIYFVSGSP